ncbi:CHAP domain-containing protein [Pseudogemmobacter sonorensis]|uniref:CHAP domain-containing protein n=1 Tax=Pseudogemmobacter sonorensis TaxID=2989681 RepID=UPI0036C1FAF1
MTSGSSLFRLSSSRSSASLRPRTGLRLAALLGAALALSACGASLDQATKSSKGFDAGQNEELKALAISEAQARRARGERVWCVPFARTASGVEIRGNAGTWWGAARGVYDRGHQPQPGAVMAFASTRKMPMGHVAVVSQVLSEREVLIDHANWDRNRISLQMSVVDVSERNDWSKVRVESTPETYGSVYPVNGFIYPEPGDAERSDG